MIKFPILISNRVTIKNVKSGFGHDLAGFYCDIYVDNRKVGYHNNDGYGGGNDYRFEAGGEKILQDVLTAAKYNEVVLEHYNESPFVSSKKWTLEEMDWEMQYDDMCEELDFLRTITKKQDKNILYGNKMQLSSSSWKGANLVQMINQMGVVKFQTHIDKIKAGLKDGDTIFNTNLEQFGITI